MVSIQLRDIATRRILVGAVVITALLPAPGANAVDIPSKPQRIVSLNLCADELVLRLADISNIASVTWLSRNPDNSNVAALAAQVPVNHGLAEEIIPSNPDMVIAGLYTTRTAAALLRRTNTPLVELAVPRDLDEIRAQIRQVANVVGERQRGEDIVAGMDARLGQIAPIASNKRPRALILNPNGFTTGAGSLVDTIIRAAGMVDVAAEFHQGGGSGQVPLETVVTSGLDVLILNNRNDESPSLATELLHHPILAELPKQTHLVTLPSRLWTCGGPAVVEAIERLSRTAADVVAGAGPE